MKFLKYTFTPGFRLSLAISSTLMVCITGALFLLGYNAEGFIMWYTWLILVSLHVVLSWFRYRRYVKFNA